MKEKTAKRWVHKGEYRNLILRRIGYCATGIFGVLFYFFVNGFFYAPTADATPTPPVVENAPFHPGIFGWILIVIGVIIAIVALCAELSQIFGFLYVCFKGAWEVESVNLITSRNHHLAPPEECLVRASTLPSSPRQAELLRAAQLGHETPPEELLRATQGTKGNET